MIRQNEGDVITLEAKMVEWLGESSNSTSSPFDRIYTLVSENSDINNTEKLRVTSISPKWLLWTLIHSIKEDNEDMLNVFFAFSQEIKTTLIEDFKKLKGVKTRNLYIYRPETSPTIYLRESSKGDMLIQPIQIEMPSSAKIVTFLVQWAVFLDKQVGLRFYYALFGTKDTKTRFESVEIQEKFKLLEKILGILKIEEETADLKFIHLLINFYLNNIEEFSTIEESEKNEYKRFYVQKNEISKAKLHRARSAPVISKLAPRVKRTGTNYKKRKRFISGFSNLSLSITGSPPDQNDFKKVTCDSQSLGILNYKRAQLGVRRRRFREFCYLGINYKEVDIAKIITSRTSELYLKVKFKDLQTERDRNTSSIIRLLTESFNNTSWWVINYILNTRRKENFTFTEDVIDRKFRLTLMISVAEELRRLQDFHSFFAVMAGLNQPHLDWIWAFVKEKHKMKFQGLNRAVKSDNGYIVYEADLSKTGSSFHIPYLGVTAQKLFALESVQKEVNKSNRIDYDLYKKRYKLIKDYLKGQQYYQSQQSIRYEAKLSLLINNQFDVVETAGEEQLLNLSKIEKNRASKGIVTRLQNSGFM